MATKKSKLTGSIHHAGAAEALRLAVGEDKQYSDGITRHRTEVEKQVIAKEGKAAQIVTHLPDDDSVSEEVSLYLPDVLKDAIFVGHLVTDLDSVAGAIGAAALYGGTPAIASEVNSETAFALEKFGVEKPRPIEDLIKENPDADICLVDHQQTSQMNPSISPDKIVGVIDHHALQSKTIVTDKPIYIDIRPWGSMSTIIAHTFITHGRRPPKHIAGMLLCAILSDTLNLQGPTTTDWDRLMVAVLDDIAEVDDIQLLASQQFKAKSKELANLSAHGLVNGDQKSFSFDASGFKGEIGFAVVETTDDEIILDRLLELLPEMVACKKERGYTGMFLAVVNIVKLHSNLLICGPTELALAKEAFGGELRNDTTVMDLGNRVSRKKDFIPVITSVIKNGWTKPSGVNRGPSQIDLSQLGHLEVDPEDPYGNVKRVDSVLQGKDMRTYSLKQEDPTECDGNGEPITID
uniref:inorganic diphosphatase n=1 Tax=Pseudictyota dubia TaxID=2749911 RepID=A0A7R9W198_9STRA